MKSYKEVVLMLDEARVNWKSIEAIFHKIDNDISHPEYIDDDIFDDLADAVENRNIKLLRSITSDLEKSTKKMPNKSKLNKYTQMMANHINGLK